MSNRGRSFRGRRPPADLKNRRTQTAQDARGGRIKGEWVKLGRPLDFIMIQK